MGKNVITIVPGVCADLAAFSEQAFSGAERAVVDGHLRDVCITGRMVTILDNANRPIAMGGIYPYATQADHGHAWSIIQPGRSLRVWARLLKAARLMLSQERCKIIDALCADNRAAQATLSHLGFEQRYLTAHGWLYQWRRP
jgi:hypothetical protein